MFSEWHRVWKRVGMVYFAGRATHLEINAFLIKRGDQLAKRRNQVAHWLATANEQAGVSLVEPPRWKQIVRGPAPTLGHIEHSPQTLMQLAVDINQWRADVMNFDLAPERRTP